MSNYNKTNGCSGCEDFWQFTKVPRPDPLTTNFERHTTLYKCRGCNSYWEESERYAIIISNQEVEDFYGKEYLNKG